MLKVIDVVVKVPSRGRRGQVVQKQTPSTAAASPSIVVSPVSMYGSGDWDMVALLLLLVLDDVQPLGVVKLLDTVQ